MICKKCGHDFPRIRTDKSIKQRRYNYRDDCGKLWSGFTCPSCFSKRVSESVKLRKKTKPKVCLESMTPVDLDPMTNRLCRTCDKPLPTSRYFTHSYCHRFVEPLWTGEEYGAGLCQFGSGY